MPDIWQTVPDSKTITIKQNVRFKVGKCPEKFQLNQIQNGQPPVVGLLTLIYLIFRKPCQITRTLL